MAFKRRQDGRYAEAIEALGGLGNIRHVVVGKPDEAPLACEGMWPREYDERLARKLAPMPPTLPGRGGECLNDPWNGEEEHESLFPSETQIPW